MPITTTPMGGMGAPMMGGMTAMPAMTTAMPAPMTTAMPAPMTTAMPAPAMTAMPGMPTGPTMTAVPGQSMVAARPIMTVTGPDFNRNGIPDALEGYGGGYGRFGYGGYGMTAAPAMTSVAAPVARPMPTMTASYVPPPVTTMARPMPTMTASYVPPPVTTIAQPVMSTSYVPPMASATMVAPQRASYVAQPRTPGKRCIGERPVARDELRATGNLVEGPPVALPRRPEPPMRVPQPVVEVVTAPPVMAAPPVQVVTAPPVIAAPPVMMMAPPVQPMMTGQMIVTGPDRNRDGIPDVLQGGPNTNVTTAMMMPGMPGMTGMPMGGMPMGGMPMMTTMMGPGGPPMPQGPHTHKETRPVTHGAHGAHGGVPYGGAPPHGGGHDSHAGAMAAGMAMHHMMD